MELEFWKLSGAGNDFIAVDNMDRSLPEEGRRELFSKWCVRGMSIGADGMLILEPADSGSSAHFRMRYYNADGGEAETCGNGSRCIARFAYMCGVAPAQMTFQTLAGDYQAEVLADGSVRLMMTDAHSLRPGVKISDDTFDGQAHFINTGVPHVVVMVDDLATTRVQEVGKYLRYHQEFAPAGTNVNFVRSTGPQALDVRTYERGVEAETLACGTGCIASAILAVREGVAKAPVHVRTAGGEDLIIDFQPVPDGAKQVSLQGSAHIVFRGYIEVPGLNRKPHSGGHHPTEHSREIESLHL